MAGTFFRVRERRLETASPGGTRKKSFAQSHLEVRMFNVKDGEAILLVFPGKRAWLIDGGSGNGDAHNQKLGGLLATYLQAAGLTLEVLVPSHAHKDHAGRSCLAATCAPTAREQAHAIQEFRRLDAGRQHMPASFVFLSLHRISTGNLFVTVNSFSSMQRPCRASLFHCFL